MLVSIEHLILSQTCISHFSCLLNQTSVEQQIVKSVYYMDASRIKDVLLIERSLLNAMFNGIDVIGCSTHYWIKQTPNKSKAKMTKWQELTYWL